MTKRSAPPPPPAPAPQQTLQAQLEELATGPGRKVIALIAIVFFFAWQGGYLQPLAQSGPLPIPSRAEVDKLRSETVERFDGVKKGIDQTLETAKSAALAAQSALQTTYTNRLDGLIARKVQYEALIAMNPADQTLKVALQRTELEIGSVSAQLQGLSSSPAQSVLTGASGKQP